jgi:hypothetical protein
MDTPMRVKTFRTFAAWKAEAERRGYAVVGDARDAHAYHPKDRKIRGEWGGPLDPDRGHFNYNQNQAGAPEGGVA